MTKSFPNLSAISICLQRLILDRTRLNFNLNMYIKSKLTQQDFINVNFVLLYRKTAIKLFTVVILIFLIVSVSTAALLPDTSLSQVIVPLAMLVVMPLVTYFGAKRNFSTNQESVRQSSIISIGTTCQ